MASKETAMRWGAKRARHVLLQGFEISHRLAGINRLDRRPNRVAHLRRVRAGLDDEEGLRNRLLEEGVKTDAFPRVSHQRRLHRVADETYDGSPSKTLAAAQVPPDRILVGPILAGEVFIDHHHGRCPQPVLIGEITSLLTAESPWPGSIRG